MLESDAGAADVPSCSLMNEVSDGRSRVPRNLTASVLPSLKNFNLNKSRVSTDKHFLCVHVVAGAPFKL